MPDNRKKCLDSLVNTQCPVEFVTPANLQDRVLENRPLHPLHI